MNEQQVQGEQVQQQNEVQGDTQHQAQEEPKMVSMTQEQFDKLISDRLSRQEKKLTEQFNKQLSEMTEAQKLSQLSDEERKEVEYNKRIKELEAREKALQDKENAYNRQTYLNEITSQLQSKGLPTDMAELLVTLSAEEVASKIASMEQSFNKQVNSSIEAKVKASANTPTIPQEEQRLLTLDEIKAMSTNEYMANRELVEKSLKALRK